MSDVSEFLRGAIPPEVFVTKAAADLQKDFAWAQALPFAKTLESWAIDALGRVLATKLSPTITALIVGELKQLLGLNNLLTT